MANPYTDPYETWKAQGRPGGSFNAWQGSQAVPQAPTAAAPMPAAAPQGFSQDWMNQGLAAYAAGQRGSDPNQTPGFDPSTFRQDYTGRTQGVDIEPGTGRRKEDLTSFSDPTLAGWMPFYNPQTGKYRSMRGAEGWFEKPTDCPPGTGPSGPNESDPCTAVGYGGAQTAPAAPQASAGVSGGPAWSGASASPLTGLLGGQAQAPQASPTWQSRPAEVQSSLTGLLAPLQNQQAAPNPLQGAVMPFQAPRRRKDPLEDMMTGFGQPKQSRWF